MFIYIYTALQGSGGGWGIGVLRRPRAVEKIRKRSNDKKKVKHARNKMQLSFKTDVSLKLFPP